MKLRLTLAGLVAIGSATFATSAHSQPTPCAPHERVIEQFAKRHGEHPIAMGLASNGAVIEVLVSEDGSTWTMIATGPGGVSCMAATGENWEQVKANYGVAN